MSKSPDADLVRDNNRKLWSAEAENWRKWYPIHRVRAKAVTDALITEAGISEGMKVLDIASGSGEPALSIARIVDTNGHVTATDMVPEMLGVAEENARKQEISNISFKVAEAERLPFTDNAFDAVTCRFGVMFFPSVQNGLREIYRVLKPDAKAAFAAWGPKEQNDSWLLTVGVILKHAKVPPQEPGSPDPYLFSEQGRLERSLRTAGFNEVMEKSLIVDYPFAGTPELAWESFSDTWKLMGVFSGVTPEQVQEIKKESIENMKQFYDGERINTKASIVVASGVKPQKT